jgi:hypothetical protein
VNDSSGLAKIGYIAACILVPALWGAITAWLFTRRDKQREAEELERRPPIDYVI